MLSVKYVISEFFQLKLENDTMAKDTTDPNFFWMLGGRGTNAGSPASSEI